MCAELFDSDETLLAKSNGLMVRLLPGQLAEIFCLGTQSQTCIRRLLNNRHCQDTQAFRTFGSTHHAVVVSSS